MQQKDFDMKEYEAFLRLTLFLNKLLDFGTGELKFSTGLHNYTIQHENRHPERISILMSSQDLSTMKIGMPMKVDLLTLDYMVINVSSWNITDVHCLLMYDNIPLLHDTVSSRRWENDSTTKVREHIPIEPIPLNSTDIERVQFVYDVAHDELGTEFVLSSLLLGQRDIIKNECLLTFRTDCVGSYRDLWSSLCMCFGHDIRYRGTLDACNKTIFRSECISA